MSAVAKLGFTAFAGGAIYFVVLAPGGAQSFQHPADTAIKRLEAKSRIVNGTGMGSLTVSGGNVSGDGVAIWVSKAGQTRRLRCLVTVTPNGDAASTAETDCSQPQVADKPLVGVGVKALDIVVREHVAATIDARDYNIDEVSDKMIALAAISAPAVEASLRPPGDEKQR